MTKFAAFDHNAIYAIGDTPDLAISRARRDVKDDEATFQTAEINDADAAEIEKDGFNGHINGFDVKGGRIVLDLKRNR